MEEQNLENFQKGTESVSEEEKKQKKPKANPKKRKANEIQEYQVALITLRKSASKEFCNPFRKQNLNMKLMPHRKVFCSLCRCYSTLGKNRKTMWIL